MASYPLDKFIEKVLVKFNSKVGSSVDWREKKLKEEITGADNEQDINDALLDYFKVLPPDKKNKNDPLYSTISDFLKSNSISAGNIEKGNGYPELSINPAGAGKGRSAGLNTNGNSANNFNGPSSPTPWTGNQFADNVINGSASLVPNQASQFADEVINGSASLVPNQAQQFADNVINGSASLVPSQSSSDSSANTAAHTPKPPVTASNQPSNIPQETSTGLKLIKGDGPADNEKPLRENGNAVFLVSGSNELFHVTEGLANEMQSNGTWTEPEVKSQDLIKNMALRMSLNHTAELGVLDIPQTGEYMLVKGDGPALSTSQLSGNGDAVYAIDKNGEKFHITGAVAEEMQSKGTWTTPAVLNQATVDAKPPVGALASANGGKAELSVPLTADNVVSVAAAAAAAVIAPNDEIPPVPISAPTPAPNLAAPVAPSFTLIRGDGPHLGEKQLVGNSAAVYAVMQDGTKLHVTAAMADKLKAANKWSEPTVRPQWEVDSPPPAGTLASLDGAVGGFEVPLNAAPAAAPAPTPAPVVAAPVEAPKLSQQQRDQIAGMYKQYLGREASTAEIDAQGAGIVGSSINMDQLNLAIANSPEAKNYQVSVVAQADAAKLAGINAQVNSLFQQYVGRVADADDLRIHGSALATGSVTTDTLKQQLAAAPESQAYRSNLINNTFQQYVGRAADQGDHQIHGTALASGAVSANQFVSSIANAPEAVAYQSSVGMPRYTQ